MGTAYNELRGSQFRGDPTDEDASDMQKECAWPRCECAASEMCDGAVGDAFRRFEEHFEKMGAYIKMLHEQVDRIPKGRL